MPSRRCPAVEPPSPTDRGRRRFVQGIAAAGIISALPRHIARAASEREQAAEPTILTGTHFDLTIERLTTNITGKPAPVIAVNGSHPAPTLRWRQGDDVTLAVTNKLSESTSIHWHGIRTPPEMDGVPGLSFPGIAPGETFHYRIPVRQCGSYWYHSHSGFQEQMGLAGALIIDPEGRDFITSDRDHVVLLSDWTDVAPSALAVNFQPQVAAYTYLINGKPPRADWTALFEPGQRIRLRFINASAMTVFDVRIPDLKMSVVAADGNAIQPVAVDEFRFAPGETYDVIVQPDTSQAYAIFAQSVSRDGYALGTLAPKSDMHPEIPALDPAPGSPSSSAHRSSTSAAPTSGEMAGMDHGAMANSDAHGSHSHHAMGAAHLHHPFVITSPEIFGTEPFPQPSPYTPRFVPAPGTDTPKDESCFVPLPANLNMRLDDPGDGLRNDGRRALAYSDLRALFPGVDGRPASRVIQIHLADASSRAAGGYGALRDPSPEPLPIKLGARIRIVLVNDTSAEYPLHLHGLWAELENGHAAYNPFKHTLRIRSGESLSYLISADTPGHWLYHSMLLYEITGALSRTIVIS